MKKVAKLVEVSFTLRVIVNSDANDDEIIQASYPKLQERINNQELGDNVTTIEDDEECPFGTSPYDK